MQCLVFQIGELFFGLPLADVQEVAGAAALLPCPGAPPVVEGLVDVHGTLAAVLDVRGRFGLPARALDVREQFVVVHAGPRLAVVRTDRVVALREVPDAAVLSGLGHVTHAPTMAGVARLPEGLLVIADFSAFLDEAERESLDRALAESNPRLR